MKAEWDKQIGGDHYNSDYQHWDLMIDVGLGGPYLAAQATRYICRHRKPSGGEGEKDLRKAIHYLDKLISVADKVTTPPFFHLDCLRRFAEVNKLSGLEQLAVATITCWRGVDDLDVAKHMVSKLLLDTYGSTVPLTDSNKHASQGDEERQDAYRA